MPYLKEFLEKRTTQGDEIEQQSFAYSKSCHQTRQTVICMDNFQTKNNEASYPRKNVEKHRLCYPCLCFGTLSKQSLI
jgi:hypothetical protein